MHRHLHLLQITPAGTQPAMQAVSVVYLLVVVYALCYQLQSPLLALLYSRSL